MGENVLMFGIKNSFSVISYISRKTKTFLFVIILTHNKNFYNHYFIFCIITEIFLFDFYINCTKNSRTVLLNCPAQNPYLNSMKSVIITLWESNIPVCKIYPSSVGFLRNTKSLLNT